MTTETETEFFKAFGIEPKPNESGYGICKKYDYLYKCKSDKRNLLDGCVQCKHFEISKCYPYITDSIQLELIVLLSKIMILKYHKFPNINELKENILTKCIYYNEDIYTRVRKLFGVE